MYLQAWEGIGDFPAARGKLRSQYIRMARLVGGLKSSHDRIFGSLRCGIMPSH